MKRRAAGPGIDGDWIALLGDRRPLRLSGPDAVLDLPAHVRAGSGLRRWRGRLVVVQDDVNALALVEASGAVTSLPLPAGDDGRRMFSERRGNKASKMDLEAAAVLPDGRLLAFGSGSTAARERIVVVGLDGRVRLVDGAALYALLRERHDFAGSELNLEGAAVVEGRLRLFQRGNGASVGGREPVNAVGDLLLDALVRWLDHGDSVPRLVAVHQVDLGRVNGVPLGFTDAAALPDGRVVFLAGAEDSPDTFHDGRVVGTRLGVIQGADVITTDILELSGAPTALKLEGLELVDLGPDRIDLLVVADMDDPDLPAVLASLSWSRR